MRRPRRQQRHRHPSLPARRVRELLLQPSSLPARWSVTARRDMRVGRLHLLFFFLCFLEGVLGRCLWLRSVSRCWGCVAHCDGVLAKACLVEVVQLLVKSLFHSGVSYVQWARHPTTSAITTRVNISSMQDKTHEYDLQRPEYASNAMTQNN